MKRIGLTLIMMAGLTALGFSQANANFAWDYGTPMPSGFEMTVTPTTGNPIVVDCGVAANKQCLVSNIPVGSYTAVVRAYNIGVPATLKAYSDPSNTVALTVPSKPPAPTNNRILTVILASIGALGVLLWALIRKIK